ncbi:N-acetylmuramoyl-L-alanine amidase [Butyrivibrio sp. AE3006]|uniref:N-acetylmuramoyl-L-alanine amidase n=1 Tax=Butyrivibrio sp. AE3006 TaxID=1280673 RepID=UPI0004796A52|nr:N-acetylmuramoyl-L-alanine amidase [Butyrivibrio sp. AE3006]
MTELIENRLKKTAIYTAIFAVISFGIMFYRAATKSILIAEATQEQAQSAVSTESFDLDISAPVGGKGEGTLVIPLEAGVSSDLITFEEKHSEHKFLLFINGRNPDFYHQNKVFSDLAMITSATCKPLNDKGNVCLEFSLDGLYENETELGDSEITVSFNVPEGLYENVVVIDPVDDIGLKLVPYIKKIMDSDDTIKVFYTRQSKEETSTEKVEALIADSEADLYVQIGTEDTDAADEGIRTFYNGVFFIREFGNIKFSDMLERCTAEAASTNALGLEEVSRDNEVIMNSVIPSAFVSIGNINSPGDSKRFGQDFYIENCAAGIVNGIKASFQIINPVAEEESTDALQGIINGN